MRELLPVKLLYVEDDYGCREAMTRFFASSCQKTVAAENGRQALELLLAERPDLVVTDLDMPEMDGLTMIANMRERGIFVPTIILSGSIGSDLRKRAASLGVFAFISKPCSLVELWAAMTAAVSPEIAGTPSAWAGQQAPRRFISF
ncbi:MAG TPA: response regulator [Geomonas sp.]|nr:response regulator [Geomonas sp.]